MYILPVMYRSQKFSFPFSFSSKEFMHPVCHASATRIPLTSCEVKVNVTLEQAMKAQRGSRGIALLFL
jgi:hypothetical protein